MRRNEEYVADEFEDKVVLFNPEDETLITLNSSAMYMWKNCDGDEDTIADNFLTIIDTSEMSEADLQTVRSECKAVIQNMKEKRVLLDE